MAPSDALAAILTRNAMTAGADTRIRFANRTYEAAFSVGLTYLDGETAAIERVQRASGHYLQRVDQPRIRLDPTRRTLGGLQITGNFNKIAGPALAVGQQPDDRIAGVRSARLRPAQLRRRLPGEPASHLPRDAARPDLPRLFAERRTSTTTGTSIATWVSAARRAPASTSRSIISGWRRPA